MLTAFNERFDLGKRTYKLPFDIYLSVPVVRIVVLDGCWSKRRVLESVKLRARLVVVFCGRIRLRNEVKLRLGRSTVMMGVDKLAGGDGTVERKMAFVGEEEVVANVDEAKL